MQSGMNKKNVDVMKRQSLLLMCMMLTVMVSRAQLQSTQGLGSSQYTIQGSDNVFSKPVQLAKPSSQGGTQSNATGQVQGGAQANVFTGPGSPGDSGGVSGGTQDPSPLPIDGGVSILVAAGVAYHLKRKKIIG